MKPEPGIKVNTDINIDISERVSGIDWNIVTNEMDKNGYSIVSQFLPVKYCMELIYEYENSPIYRKSISMEKHSFGQGKYKYFKYPLPHPIQLVRTEIYSKLVFLANKWMMLLNKEQRFPENFYEFQGICHANSQNKPTVLILKYDKGGYNALHQDLYGDIFFPFQVIFH